MRDHAPVDRHPTVAMSQGAVLGGVGGQFVEDHAQRQGAGGRQGDVRPVQAQSPHAMRQGLMLQHRAQVRAFPVALGEQVVGVRQGHQPRLKGFGERAGVLMGAGRLHGDRLNGGQGVLHAMIELVDHQLLPFGGHDDIRHVMPLNKHADHARVLVPDGLIGEVDVAIGGRSVGRMLQAERALPAHDRFPGLVHVVQEVEMTLLAQLGQGVFDGAAQNVAMIDEPVAGLITKLDDMI
uniref:ABC transporter ATP-binding protein n=1 Tax=Parastrongyloides trichosuri TaxID=131310 RepID=A0A0N4Z8C3_PARTI